MMPPTLLDEAELKLEFRKIYGDVGYVGCLQVLYEFLVSANWLADVMREERAKENGRAAGE